MSRSSRRSKPRVLQGVVAVSALLVLGALYLALMHVTVRVSQLDAGHTASDRDRIALYIHAGVLLAGAVTGFGLGKWLNGLGVSYAVLFVVVLAVAMVLAQLGSFSLACHGHNDLIRHWTC